MTLIRLVCSYAHCTKLIVVLIAHILRPGEIC